MKPKVIIVHPGTQHAPQLGSQLYRIGVLKKYITSLGFAGGGLMANFFIKIPKIYKKLSSRILENIPAKKIKTFPIPELKFLIRQKLKNSLNIQQAVNVRNKALQILVNDTDIDGCDIVIGYDTSSWIIAKRARDKGKKFILDQTTCHSHTKQKYIDFLIEKYPDWYTQENKKKSKQLIKQETIEHHLADLIVVPSYFVKKSLIDNGVASTKIIINPYGTNTEIFKNFRNRDFSKESLIFLFVGAINANKGIPDLIAAWVELDLKSAELWIVGHGVIATTIDFEKYGIKILGKLPKKLLGKIYNQADVLICPSYFEGLAQVQIEALSCGLPIIGTYNSGATELITPGVNGFIVNPGEIDELKSAIEWFLANKDQLCIMSEQASLASTDLTWDAYGDRWKHIIESLLV